MKDQITIKEAANICNKSVHTIKKLIQEKKIKSTKIQGNNGLEIRLERGDILKYYDLNNDPNIFIKVDPNNPNNQKIETETNEVLELRKDKEKLFAQIESRTLELERMQKLFENQQTLMLGLQQQIKTLTDNSTQNIQNIPGKPKTKHTAVEAKVSNSPQTHTDPLNFDFYDESNQVPVEAKKTPQKRRKWWFF
jgi:excisionase family DNA binding protein